MNNRFFSSFLYKKDTFKNPFLIYQSYHTIQLESSILWFLTRFRFLLPVIPNINPGLSFSISKDSEISNSLIPGFKNGLKRFTGLFQSFRHESWSHFFFTHWILYLSPKIKKYESRIHVSRIGMETGIIKFITPSVWTILIYIDIDVANLTAFVNFSSF